MKRDHAKYKFFTSSEAWNFMRQCDEAGILAGFPGLLVHTVEIGIPTWHARETADRLAVENGGHIIDYKFGEI